MEYCVRFQGFGFSVRAPVFLETWNVGAVRIELKDLRVKSCKVYALRSCEVSALGFQGFQHDSCMKVLDEWL